MLLSDVVSSVVNRSGLSPYYKEKLLASGFFLTRNPRNELVATTDFWIPWSEHFTPEEEDEYEAIKDKVSWILFTIEGIYG